METGDAHLFAICCARPRSSGVGLNFDARGTDYLDQQIARNRNGRPVFYSKSSLLSSTAGLAGDRLFWSAAPWRRFGVLCAAESGGMPTHTKVPSARTKVVRLAGLEPATPGLGNRCSIHLSYRRTLRILFDLACKINPESPFILSKGQAGLDVLPGQVRIILDDLRVGHAGSQPTKHITHGDADPADARLAPTLAWFQGDDFAVIDHRPTY